MRALLLIDHGSRRAEANETLSRLAVLLENHLRGLGDDAIVEAAHMELAEPSIREGALACARRGASHIVALPCMLSRGRHVTDDIPHLLAEALSSLPGVTFQLGPPLSELDGFVPMLAESALLIARSGTPTAPTPGKS